MGQPSTGQRPPFGLQAAPAPQTPQLGRPPASLPASLSPPQATGRPSMPLLRLQAAQPCRDTRPLTVNAATSVSFVVTPATASIPVSGTQQFAAIQTFSDGTTVDRTTTSAAGTTIWSTSRRQRRKRLSWAGHRPRCRRHCHPAGVPVVINATFTPVGGLALSRDTRCLDRERRNIGVDHGDACNGLNTG